MAIPWPSQLQQLVNEQSFAYKFGETVIRSDVDVGPKKVRRRFTRPINTATVSIDMDVSQYNIFYNFFFTTINAGVTPFELAHPITGVLKQWRFLEPPDIRPTGGVTFTANMQWEEMP